MSNIVIALQITALGMSLVFAAIILLWWMMTAITSIMAEPLSTSDATATDSAGPATAMDSDIKARAAAVAVAMALAEQEIVHPLSTPPTAMVSAWQLGMRTRQLSQKGISISRKPRKAG
jgi:Na+-transporting methylmalonyl-CoA/oxaloacetate decarboxylase gamma subunit